MRFLKLILFILIIPLICLVGGTYARMEHKWQ